MSHPADYHALVGAAVGGDESAFATLVARHRRELHVHCYRMLASFDEAEDVVQEALLRAWLKRDTFTGGAGFRAWLYRIATNACLDALRRSNRQLTTLGGFEEVPWLQPYPDRLLNELQPETAAVARETIELAYLAAIQLLSPTQRATLILRDVLGWSAAETASLLESTVPATNSALQRARATLAERAPARDEAGSSATYEQRALLDRFVDAHEHADTDAALAMLCADARVTMPPLPMRFDGIDVIAGLMRRALGEQSIGDWRLVPTWANRQPAAASYLRAHGDTEFRAFKLDVLRLRDGKIAEITTFNAELFGQFGLARQWPAEPA
jgi:RNA polymerase sigma-70 factor (TIGR02960 family)